MGELSHHSVILSIDTCLGTEACFCSKMHKNASVTDKFQTFFGEHTCWVPTVARARIIKPCIMYACMLDPDTLLLYTSMKLPHTFIINRWGWLMMSNPISLLAQKLTFYWLIELQCKQAFGLFKFDLKYIRPPGVLSMFVLIYSSVFLPTSNHSSCQ